jgi:DNA-binding Lrp family transcriptional regulator
MMPRNSDHNEKAFLAAIEAKETTALDWVKITNAEMAKLLKRSERTVQRTRKKLEDAGAIELRRIEHDGSTATSRLLRRTR